MGRRENSLALEEKDFVPMKTNQDVDDAIHEHQQLVKVLRSTSRDDDRVEAKKQARELQELRRKKALAGLPRKKAPDARSGIELGDSLYVHHPKHGPMAVKVCAKGQHGITGKDDKGRAHQVKWQHVLGAKQRISQQFSVVDQGEDGAILEDAQGERRFLKIGPQTQIEQEPQPKGKALATRRRPRMIKGLILFFKARRFKDQPGYALQTHRWHTITPSDEPGGKSSTPAPSPFQPDPAQAQAFRQSLDRALTSRQSVVAPIVVGDTPAVLTALGVPAKPIVISRDVARKATNGVKHNVPIDAIKQLPEILADPVMVFDSATIIGGRVVLADSVDQNQRPVVVALHLSVKGKHHIVHQIASLHGRPEPQIINWIRDGLLRYRQTQKCLEWFQYRGLQLPKEGTTQGIKEIVLTEADIVKPSAPLQKAATLFFKAHIDDTHYAPSL